MRGLHGPSAVVAMLCAHSAAAQDFKLGSTEGISSSAQLIAERLMDNYKASDGESFVPGILVDDDAGIYFWQSGVFMGSMIDYWHLTGDDTYNDAIQTGMLHQVGEDENFMPANQTRMMGNDDQCYWALAAMTAAESGFQENTDDEPQWLDLAKAVYENQVERLDKDDTCEGGLRWQVFSFNIGYNYKNTISSACLMNLGARLARYTGEKKYAETTEELWDWLVKTGLIDADTWAAYEGTNVDDDCSEVDKYSFSNAASMLTYSAAVMYNYTDGSDTWRERVEKLSNAILDNYFEDGVAIEAYCEPDKICNVDQRVYKGLLHRYLAASTQLAPFLVSETLPKLKTSAKAAVDQCTGGKTNTKCGFYWSEGEYHEPEGLGITEDMNVLSAVTNLLISEAEAPGTSSSEEGNGDDDDGSPSSTGSDSGSPTESGDAESATETEPSAGGHVGPSIYTVVLAGCGLLASNYIGLL